MNFAAVFATSLWSGYALPACHPENGASAKGIRSGRTQDRPAPIQPQGIPAPEPRRPGYFLAGAGAGGALRAVRPVPRPRPILLANSERCSAYFGATIG